MIREISKINSIHGDIYAPGDKSISHRAIMCSALAKGDSKITNFLMGDDCMKTIGAFRELGVDIDVNENEVIVHGKGYLSEPRHIIDAGNSGTTSRLLLGILAGQDFNSIVDGDESLRLRPMGRVIEPLTMMGGSFLAKSDKYLPVNIFGKPLHAIDYEMTIASAQVKSAIIFASLFQEGITKIHECGLSRNHTELMLKSMGANLKTYDNMIEVGGGVTLRSHDIYVQGDISSASYFIVATLITKDSEMMIRNVNINKTRAGILDVLMRMGGDIRIENVRNNIELMADIYVKSSHLHGTEIGGAEIPTLIDELPIIAIAAMVAEGTTIVHDASELKVKETNRIDTICDMVTKLGGDIEPLDDGFVIEGVESIKGGFVNTHGDHRIAMAGSVGALIGEESSHILDVECIDISFPDFFEILERIAR